jgi:hypothetical protein
MSETQAIYATPLEVGQPIPLRVAEKLPVTLTYLQALALRETLAIAEKLIRSMANDMSPGDGSDRDLQAQTESLADDLRAGELLLRGEG